MAALGLDEDEHKALEQLVSRVSQLASSIQSFKADVAKSSPLPSPASLQASCHIIQRNLQTVLDSLAENKAALARMAVHPSPNFPGRAHEGVLTQLLRTKLEPDVEELVARGLAAAHHAAGLAALADVWRDVRAWTLERIARYVRHEAADVYTRAEREAGVAAVRTGLRRPLDDAGSDDDEEDEEDEEEEEEDARAELDADFPQPVGPEAETLLFFAATGHFDLPRNMVFERSTGPLKRGLEGVNVAPVD